MSEHTPFLTIFPGCGDLMSLAGGLEKAFVTDVQIELRKRSMTVSARFAAMPSMVDITTISDRLRTDYALDAVSILPDYPRIQSASPSQAGAGGGKEPGAKPEVAHATISVNHPMRWRGWWIYQSAYDAAQEEYTVLEAVRDPLLPFDVCHV